MEPEAKMRWIPAEPRTVAGVAFGAAARQPVSGIPSLFGQLVALASQARTEIEASGKIDPSLSLAWQSAFLRWLCLDLVRQKSDLDSYAAWLGTKATETLAGRCLAELGRLAPLEASRAERMLFLSETRALFEMAGFRQPCRRG